MDGGLSKAISLELDNSINEGFKNVRKVQQSGTTKEFNDAQDALTEAGVPVSCNLTGQTFVNQAAAFSDFHVSGANPAGNATLCDAAFVVNRFRMVHTRVQV